MLAIVSNHRYFTLGCCYAVNTAKKGHRATCAQADLWQQYMQKRFSHAHPKRDSDPLKGQNSVPRPYRFIEMQHSPSAQPRMRRRCLFKNSLRHYRRKALPWGRKRPAQEGEGSSAIIRFARESKVRAQFSSACLSLENTPPSPASVAAISRKFQPRHPRRERDHVGACALARACCLRPFNRVKARYSLFWSFICTRDWNKRAFLIWNAKNPRKKEM